MLPGSSLGNCSNEFALSKLIYWRGVPGVCPLGVSLNGGRGWVGGCGWDVAPPGVSLNRGRGVDGPWVGGGPCVSLDRGGGGPRVSLNGGGGGGGGPLNRLLWA